jgi:hypothetical protein
MAWFQLLYCRYVTTAIINTITPQQLINTEGADCYERGGRCAAIVDLRKRKKYRKLTESVMFTSMPLSKKRTTLCKSPIKAALEKPLAFPQKKSCHILF